MDGIMNKNQLTIVKECKFDKPLIQKIKWITLINVRIHKYKYSYNCMYTQL